MFIFDPITLEYTWVPRSVCFADIEGAEDGGGGGEGAEGDPPAEPAAEPAADAPTDDWRAAFPDDVKKQAERFGSAEDAVRAVMDLRKRESQARVPGKDADEKEVAAFQKAIGVPESAEGYTFSEVEELSDELKASRADWAGTFHELNVPAETAAKLEAKFNEMNVAAVEAMQQQDKLFAEQESEALHKKWPGAEYDRQIEFANRAMGQLAERVGLSVDELRNIETKDGRFLMDRSDMAQMFSLVGREMSEDTLGAVGEGERETLTEQIDDLHKQTREAQAARDDKKANALYKKTLELTAKRDGSKAA